MQRRELKFVCVSWCWGIFRCLSCRGVNWNLNDVNTKVTVSVASHAEAWIEITQDVIGRLIDMLPLMQRRELKYSLLLSHFLHSQTVASHAEAWIEISAATVATAASVFVASHAEAWIEISSMTAQSEIWCVASHAEAWIEIKCRFRFHRSAGGCLSCRGVNWNSISICRKSRSAGCLSCRGVNWNYWSLLILPVR